MFTHEGPKLIVKVVFKWQWHGNDLTGQSHLISSTEMVEFDMDTHGSKTPIVYRRMGTNYLHLAYQSR